jgi:hypothetical protein
MIKKIKNFTVNYLVPILILVIPFSLPLFKLDFDVNIILTIVALLFTILAGFFIAAATSNYLRLQTLIADLNGGMISIFNIVKLISPNSIGRVTDAIDEYVISTLDYDLLDFAGDTMKDFENVVSVIDEVRPENSNVESLLQNLHSEKTRLYSNHQEMAMVAKTIVSPRHWTILILLASLIAILILALRNGQVISSLVAVALIYTTYQILKLLQEIDNNLFLGKKLAFEDPQHVFRVIGRLPYYPQYAIESNQVKIQEKTYRVGTYVNVSGSRDKRIEIIGQ